MIGQWLRFIFQVQNCNMSWKVFSATLYGWMAFKTDISLTTGSLMGYLDFSEKNSESYCHYKAVIKLKCQIIKHKFYFRWKGYRVEPHRQLLVELNFFPFRPARLKQENHPSFKIHYSSLKFKRHFKLTKQKMPVNHTSSIRW